MESDPMSAQYLVSLSRKDDRKSLEFRMENSAFSLIAHNTRSVFCAMPQNVDTFVMLPSKPTISLNVKVHFLPQRSLVTLQLMYCDILADLFPRNDLLVQNGRSSSLEDVTLLLLASLVGLDVTSL